MQCTIAKVKVPKQTAVSLKALSLNEIGIEVKRNSVFSDVETLHDLISSKDAALHLVGELFHNGEYEFAIG